MAHHIQIIGDAMLGGQGRETRAGKVRLTYIATWPRSFPSRVAPPISSTKLLIAMARRIVGALGCSRRTPCPKSYLDCHLKVVPYSSVNDGVNNSNNNGPI